MKIHQLYRKQTLKLSLDQAWKFFSSPHNLNTITPDFFNIKVTSKMPEEIYSGLMISYTMHAVAGIPMSWLSEVSHCKKTDYFVYEQRIGPFKFWSHEVRLTQQQSEILLEDIVFYAMPMGILGLLLHNLLIRQKLEQIFATRYDYLTNRWG